MTETSSHAIALSDALAARGRQVMIEGVRPTIDDALLGIGPPFGDAEALMPRTVATWKSRPILRSPAMRAALNAVVAAPKVEQLEQLQAELVRSLRVLGDPQQREQIEDTLLDVDMLLAWSLPKSHGSVLAMLAAERACQPGANAADRLHAAATAIAYAATAAPKVAQALLCSTPAFRGRGTTSPPAIAARIAGDLTAFAAVAGQHRDKRPADAEFDFGVADEIVRAWLATPHSPVIEPSQTNTTSVALDDLLCLGQTAEVDPAAELRAFARASTSTNLSDCPEFGAMLAEIGAARHITPKALHAWRERLVHCGADAFGTDGGDLIVPTLRRLDVTAAVLGVADAALRIGCWLATRIETPDFHARTRLIAAALALLRIAATAHPCTSHLAEDLSEEEEPGSAYRELVHETIAKLATALTEVPLVPRVPDQQPPGTLAALWAEAEEVPAAERERLARAADRVEAEGRVGATAMIVVQSIGDGKSSASREMTSEWRGLVGTPVPLIPRPDLSAIYRRLVGAMPHARIAIDTILRDAVAAPTVTLRPTLLVGPPGNGKTFLLTRLCQELGLPHRLIPCGGVSDAAFCGTSRQWSTGRASVPLQAVRAENAANVAMVLDEVEKIGTSRHNGNLVDGLLGLLEPNNAKQFFDPYLEGVVDLSRIVWLATANDLDPLHPALRDRFRILVLPEPTADDLPALIGPLMAEICRQRGIDPVWVPPLDAVETDIVSQLWPGGSLRRLARILEAVICARDRPQRAH